MIMELMELNFGEIDKFSKLKFLQDYKKIENDNSNSEIIDLLLHSSLIINENFNLDKIIKNIETSKFIIFLKEYEINFNLSCSEFNVILKNPQHENINNEIINFLSYKNINQEKNSKNSNQFKFEKLLNFFSSLNKENYKREINNKFSKGLISHDDILKSMKINFLDIFNNKNLQKSENINKYLMFNLKNLNFKINLSNKNISTNLILNDYEISLISNNKINTDDLINFNREKIINDSKILKLASFNKIENKFNETVIDINNNIPLNHEYYQKNVFDLNIYFSFENFFDNKLKLKPDIINHFKSENLKDNKNIIDSINLGEFQISLGKKYFIIYNEFIFYFIDFIHTLNFKTGKYNENSIYSIQNLFSNQKNNLEKFNEKENYTKDFSLQNFSKYFQMFENFFKNKKDSISKK